MTAAINVKIFDSFPSAVLKTISIMDLQFQHTLITASELIEQRIITEMNKIKRRSVKQNSYLVDIRDDNKVLDVNSLEVETNKQIELAKIAFRKNGYFIIVDNEQIEGLETEFLIHEQSKIEFFRLTVLVGG